MHGTKAARAGGVCPNTLEVPLDATETAVLKAIEHDILRVEVLETVLAKALAALQPSPDVLAGPELTLRDELARIDSEVAHLAGAIAAGGELAALLVALQERERRRVYLRGQLATLARERAATHRSADAEHLADELRGHLSDWQALLRQETGPARRALQSLLVGRLVFTPRERDGEEGFYSFEGEGTVTSIITGATASQGVWWPQRECPGLDGLAIPRGRRRQGRVASAPRARVCSPAAIPSTACPRSHRGLREEEGLPVVSPDFRRREIQARPTSRH
jgi:hypothetical protein